MHRIVYGSTHNLADTNAFLALLTQLPAELSARLDAEQDVIVTRAPGRLDLIGGIADYSGSLVLQLPIAAAAHVALQLRSDRRLRIASLSADDSSALRQFEMSLDEFLAAGVPSAYEVACARFKQDAAQEWAAYVAGAFLVLMRELGARFQTGANILIRSAVPEGKGVSSSAALEVAALQAICAAYGLPVPPRELAFLCQKVENFLAGAPCGVMDQMTAACGEADRLLSLLCQPGELRGTVKLPAELAVWGIDSGIRHSVGGADYGTVRTAAFMGYRLIAAKAGLLAEETETPGWVRIADPNWQGYLANLTPAEFYQSYAAALPTQMTGAEFLRDFAGITDRATTVLPARSYPVLQATRHPIEENARVRRFAEILENWQGLAQAEELGALMYQAHESYSACGLGSSGTDELVRLVQAAGSAAGLFGAKITGGGSGGTVAVLGRKDAASAVRAVAEQYARLTGRQPLLIEGSSLGAAQFGYLRLQKEST